MDRRETLLGAAGLTALIFANGPSLAGPVNDAAMNSQVERIGAYKPRFGRSRPVIAVVGHNNGTETTDFVIPYGVLARSGVADVVSVAPASGSVSLFPALRIEAQKTLAQFDVLYPQGADYVIVPNMRPKDDPVVLLWLKAQFGKDGTLVSICEGANTVANTGLMNGRRATAYYGTEALRVEMFPAVLWQKNIRYVADGRIVSSAGISASMPISVALVEAIAGRPRAEALARQEGIHDWSSRHSSDDFQLVAGEVRPRFGGGPADAAIGVPIFDGIDEVALALTAEAWSQTGHSQAYALSTSNNPVQSRNGLTFLPERVAGTAPLVERALPSFRPGPSTIALDQALSSIATVYGRRAAYASARMIEYPGFHAYRD